MGWGFRRVALLLSACAALPAADPATFEKTVAPVLTKACTPCHNENLASGGMNIAQFTQACFAHQEPRGLGHHPAQDPRRRDAAQRHAAAARRWMPSSNTCSEEFEKADRNVKPDPGRVTARRLNRTEYSNTIRDLLGVEFRAEQSFPTDDLGNGFDNIGDVLTISPVLMEKYLAAAGRIAVARRRRRSAAQAARSRSTPTRTRRSAASISAPSKPTAASSSTANTPSASDCRASAPPDAKPVDAGLLDGRQADAHHAGARPSPPGWSTSIRTPKSRCACSSPKATTSSAPASSNDDFVKGLTREGRLRPQEEQVPGFDHVRRPVRAQDAAGQPRARSSSATRSPAPPCVEKIVANLAHRA